MSTSGARSLTEWLRAQPDEALAALLAARPDLAVPPPGDVYTLANRTGIRFSVLRALEELDAFTLQVLDALLLAAADGAAGYADARRLLAGAPSAAVRPAVDRLRRLALAWGDDDALRPVGTVREVVGPYPAGLGRPAAVVLATASSARLAPVLATLGLPELRQPEATAAVAAVLADRARLDGLLAECGPREREVLSQLAAGPPIGSVRDALRPATGTDADPPVRRLLARGLLVGIDAETVELPREVGLALRADRPLGPLLVDPPPVRTDEPGESTVDAVGTGQVLTALRLAERLAETYTADPPGELRSGGLGVRELRRTARALDAPEPVAAMYAEVLRAAGLLGSSGGPEPVWLPTAQYDDWLGQPPPRRWVALARAWLGMARLPSLVGQRDERGRALAALSLDLERTSAPGTRRRVLAVLAALPPGTAAAEPAEVAARLAWQAPRRGGQRAEVVAGVLIEAEAIGVTGRGALTSYGRALLAADPAAGPGAAPPVGTGRRGPPAGAGAGPAADPAGVLAERLPEPVDSVLVQADLTVVAPGPLEPDLARDLALVADIESAGGATVYRVTDATVRRALDAGRSAVDLHELFRTRSRTPVPQALSYLVDDVARRHGVLRVGTASAYLRCDDEALLAAVLADRRTDPLRLHRIAPTVVTSRSAVNRVLEVLRQAGYAPVAESATGTVVLTRPDTRRAAAPVAAVRAPAEPPAATDVQLAELVRAMRAGDRAADEAAQQAGRVGGPGTGAELGSVPGVTTARTLGLLRQAAQEGRAVWLGYVDAQGSASQRIVEPVSVSGGYLHGFDHKRDEMRTFALHRITGVTLIGDDDPATDGEVRRRWRG